MQWCLITAVVIVLAGKSSTAVGRSLAPAAHLHICSGRGACLLQCYNYAPGRCKGKQAKPFIALVLQLKSITLVCCFWCLLITQIHKWKQWEEEIQNNNAAGNGIYQNPAGYAHILVQCNTCGFN